MWFKQVQLFQLPSAFRYSPEALVSKLEALLFHACLPSMPLSMGWISPHEEEDGPLFRAINGRISLCLQVEEKILPATVIRQALFEKIKEIEADGVRKVYQKEKLALKDEIILTLLPRAFSKFTKVHAYIDTQKNWLVLNTTNAKKTEQFFSIFRKSVTDEVYPLETQSISSTLTDWITRQSYPSTLGILKSCILQDPDHQNRVIRCQQQDLFSESVKSFISKEGCRVKQLALSWHDYVEFTLTENMLLQSIKFQDQIVSQTKDLDIETRQQQFDADFMIMSETLSSMLELLVNLFCENEKEVAVA